MNWLDIVIIVVVLLLTFLGFRTGIIRAAAMVAGVVLGVVLAGVWALGLADKLTFTDNEGARTVIAYAIIFVAVFVAANIAGVIVRKIVRLIFLGFVDRLGGAALGFVVGVAVLAVLLVGARAFPLPEGTPEQAVGWVDSLVGAIDDSSLGSILVDTYPVVLAFLPEEFDVIKEKLPQ